MGSDAPVDETDARDFWAIYEARYAAVNSATLEAAREDPSFAPIVEAMAPEVIDAQRQEGHEDLRRAMAGDWAGYADKLKSQGVTYAALGVEMAAWQRLVRVAERALTPELVGAFIDEPPRLTRALCAMQDFFAWVIGVIAESYLESKQAALKASELRFRRLSESGMIGVMVADLEGGFHEANDAFLDMIGHTREELEDGRVRWTEMTPPEWEEADRVAVEQLTERGFADPFEKEYIRADGARVPVLLCVAMLEPPYVVCLALDRTREYELERFQERADELQQENRRIQEASRLKSEFLANMSHELRTPLNAIIGFAELLHDGQVPHDAPEHQEFLGDILTSGRHLLQLINDVLDLSKVEAGKLDFHPEEIDLEKVVGEVVSILRTSAATGRIDLSVEVDPAADTAYLDPSRLKQVLYNYVSNALKFTDEGGAVVIRVLPEAEGVLRVEVEDDGVGIAPEDAGKLFVAFQQLDGGAGKSHAGTGLGLALTRRLVEAQGGTVGVDSEPGRGSRFYAVLPRRCENGTALPSPRRFEAPPGAPRVLVVEDDARDQTLIATSLSQAGYAVETVSTGAQALARCREVAFDAVTLDLILPDHTGLDVLQQIRREGPNRDVPVLVVTVVTERRVVAGFAVHDILPKPVDAHRLVRSLRSAGVRPEGKDVLVVDDDPNARKQMTTALEGQGFAHRVAEDGAAAIEEVERERPAAVVLDLVMPRMDGFAFLERLRRTPGCQTLPVLVWTAKDLATEERARLADAVQGIVGKSPGVAAALVAELGQHLQRGERDAASEEGA